MTVRAAWPTRTEARGKLAAARSSLAGALERAGARGFRRTWRVAIVRSRACPQEQTHLPALLGVGDRFAVLAAGSGRSGDRGAALVSSSALDLAMRSRASRDHPHSACAPAPDKHSASREDCGHRSRTSRRSMVVSLASRRRRRRRTGSCSLGGTGACEPGSLCGRTMMRIEAHARMPQMLPCRAWEASI